MLTVSAAVALSFFAVSGGPFGLEVAIRAVGFWPTLFGIFAFPLLLSLPVSIITSEMFKRSAPEYSLFRGTQKALGAQSAYFIVIVNVVASVLDLSAAARLLSDYVSPIIPEHAYLDRASVLLSLLVVAYITSSQGIVPPSRLCSPQVSGASATLLS